MRASVRAPLTRFGLSLFAYLSLGSMLAGNGWGKGPRQACVQAVIEGEVKHGESFDRRLGDGLSLRLEAVESGWIVRFLREDGGRRAEDFAELATPPYQSVNPLRLTTEFGFRAQDAIGWNPRRFHYANGDLMFRQMEEVYHRLGGKGPDSVQAERALARLVSVAPEGSIELLDARLIPGGGDQTKAAALLATHFSTTAHTVETTGGGGAAMPLGRLLWLRFRVVLDVPRAGASRQGVRYRTTSCVAP